MQVLKVMGEAVSDAQMLISVPFFIERNRNQRARSVFCKSYDAKW